MTDEPVSGTAGATAAPTPAGAPLKRLWQSIRGPLAGSQRLNGALASVLASYIRLVQWTNPRVPGSDDIEAVVRAHHPAIFGLWHGQHVLSPMLKQDGTPGVGLVSRSKDAELTALVTQKLGHEVVRGSGGRDRSKAAEKGGARALIALKKALMDRKTVFMIADIPNGTPRDAGLGIVTLARISGRPILCCAIVTSRRKVMEKTWDRMSFPLPFGRLAICVEDPIFVEPDADEAAMEAARLRVTEALDTAHRRADALLGHAA